LAHIDFVSILHKKTVRDYLGRVTNYDKASCSKVAKQFGKDYWDGERQYGYGGYYYNGWWKPVAKSLVDHYKLKEGQRVLDVGCGKGFLLYELTQLVPGLEVCGIDISQYALLNAKDEVKPYLKLCKAQELDFEDNYFDFVYSITTLHNLYVYDLKKSIEHIQRVSRGNSYIVVESYRDEREKANLLYWQLTCESFYTPQEWEWLYDSWGYKGDYSFIYFE
jgi:protein-L-isoaspartate(D-aspartate) O-methyltransferase